MLGKTPLVLKDGEIAFSYSSTSQGLRDKIEEKWNRMDGISILGGKYSVYPKVLSDTIVTLGEDSNLALVVPDAVLDDNAGNLAAGFAASQTFLQFDCNGISKETQDILEKKVSALFDENSTDIPYYMITRNDINASYAGTKAIIAYVGIYVGLVFLLTSAAVLSLQQLSEVADSRQRYLVLKKVGADDRLIDRAIFRQTAIYFLLPLSLAIVHSIVGLRVANDAVRSMGGVNAAQNILITALIIILVYGGYFLATFIGSRQMIVREDRNE